MKNPRLDELKTPVSKLVRLYLLHYGPVATLAQIERELGISHKALWQAKQALIDAGMWQENAKQISTL